MIKSDCCAPFRFQWRCGEFFIGERRIVGAFVVYGKGGKQCAVFAEKNDAEKFVTNGNIGAGLLASGRKKKEDVVKRKARTDREYQEILKLRQDGKTFAEISEDIGVSIDYARRLVELAKRKEKNNKSDNPFDWLSDTARRRIQGAGLVTVNDVTKAIDDGRLENVCGVGKKTIDEIRKWLILVDRKEHKK